MLVFERAHSYSNQDQERKKESTRKPTFVHGPVCHRDAGKEARDCAASVLLIEKRGVIICLETPSFPIQQKKNNGQRIPRPSSFFSAYILAERCCYLCKRK